MYRMLIYTPVSEPIALQLRASTGNIYLHAQIFAGFMYLAAALCMWVLRAWKIGQIQQLAIEEKPSEDVDAVSSVSKTEMPPMSGSHMKEFSIVKHLITWKKV